MEDNRGKITIAKVIKKLYVGDTSLWVVLFALLGGSLMAIYSSSLSVSYAESHSSFNYYLYNQMFMILVGFVALTVVRFIPIVWYKKGAKAIFYVSVALMLYTLLFGVEINGARRWISILGLTIQTSDIFKIGMFIYLTKLLWKRRDEISEIVFLPIKELFNLKKEGNAEYVVNVMSKDGFPVLIPALLSVALIMPENMSTSLVFGMMIMIIFFLFGVKKSELLKMIMIAMCAVALLVTVFAVTGSGRFKTWKSRVTQFVSGTDNVFDEKGDVRDLDALSLDEYQRLQSDIAIANGWGVGKGFGNSVQRSHLPKANADFIYSFIVEEWGVVGAGIVFLLFLWLFKISVRIANECHDSFSAMLCMSMGLLVASSAFFHMGVCVGLLPVTGLTLPLISHGGTSMLFTFVNFGILFRISYEQKIISKLQIEEDKESL